MLGAVIWDLSVLWFAFVRGGIPGRILPSGMKFASSFMVSCARLLIHGTASTSSRLGTLYFVSVGPLPQSSSLDLRTLMIVTTFAVS